MNNLQGTMLKKLLLILHRGFAEARNLALTTGSQQQLFDLADTFEMLPNLMSRWDESSLGQIRNALANYQQRYRTSYDNLAIVDMDDPAFDETFGVDPLSSAAPG
jgi:hypothetical protein